MQAEMAAAARSKIGDVGNGAGRRRTYNGRELVEPSAVDDHHVFRTEGMQRVCHQRHDLLGVDSDDHARRSGRVEERTEDIEDGAHAESLADGHDVLHGGMEGGSEHERDASLLQARLHTRRRLRNLDSKLFEDISRAALRGDRPVAVLGDLDAARGDDEGGAGREVDRVEAVAARAHDVDRRSIGLNTQHVRTHGRDHACNLLRRLTLGFEQNEEGGCLAVVDAGNDRTDARLRLRARQVRPRAQLLDQRLESVGHECCCALSIGELGRPVTARLRQSTKQGRGTGLPPPWRVNTSPEVWEWGAPTPQHI